MLVNSILHGSGTLCAPPLLWDFCPLLKNSECKPYLKILDFSQPFVADAHMEKNPKIKYLVS